LHWLFLCSSASSVSVLILSKRVDIFAPFSEIVNLSEDSPRMRTAELPGHSGLGSVLRDPASVACRKLFYSMIGGTTEHVHCSCTGSARG
jgi:hypothetical protein